MNRLNRIVRWSAGRSVMVVSLAAFAVTAFAADHPTLVDPEQATCETCHDEILAVLIPHPPAVDDCLACHEFDQSGDRTSVELMETGSTLCLACHDEKPCQVQLHEAELRGVP